MILAGFDCQFTSKWHSIMKHTASLYDIISIVESSYAKQVRVFDSLTIKEIQDGNITYLVQNKDSIKYHYSQLLTFIDNHFIELVTEFPGNKIYPAFLRQTITSIIANFDHMLLTDLINLSGFPGAYKIRDSAMAANVVFLKDMLYPGKK